MCKDNESTTNGQKANDETPKMKPSIGQSDCNATKNNPPGNFRGINQNVFFIRIYALLAILSSIPAGIIIGAVISILVLHKSICISPSNL